MTYKIGDRVIVTSRDNRKGIIKSLLGDNKDVFLIDLGDSMRCWATPIGLEIDKQYYREKRLKEILKN